MNNYVSMTDKNSIKDVVTLFENDLRDEKQLIEFLDSKTKDELVKHILAELGNEEGSEEEDGTDTELEY